MFQRLFCLLSMLRAVLAEWHCRARSRREISSLDCDTIRDLGLSASQMRFEAEKPFWQA